MERVNFTDITKKRALLENYQDKNAIREVLGCLMKQPQLLKKYSLRLEDFCDILHRLLFSVILNMGREGATNLQPHNIESYLKENYPVKHDFFIKSQGIKYLENAMELCSLENFEMNYNTIRKWALLRELTANHIDVSEYYDPEDILMGEETEKKRDKFENDSLEEISFFYQNKISKIKNIFIKDSNSERKKAGGEETLEQIALWKQFPDFGMSYASQILSTVTYGIRRQKFTIMSAASGTGKSRFSLANMCFSFAPYFWDSKKAEWVPNPHGTENCALYIGTEMDLKKEVEPIILAYMADVPEDHITQNQYALGTNEEERVLQAAEFLRPKDDFGNDRKCGIYLVNIPEYSATDIEEIIEEYVTLYGISAVFFDYIYSNPRLLAEYATTSKGNYHPRDDQALSYLSTKLKEFAVKYNISIDACTQVSGDYKNEENFDETIVRGAKSIIDKCDIGLILSGVTQKEKTKLEPITRRAEMLSKPAPNVCLTVYKNRGGRYNKVKIWLSVDYSTMRVHDLFATNKEYEIMKIAKSRVIIDTTGKTHVFTDRDAMEQYKLGLISKETLNQVIQIEKEDPSYKNITQHDQEILAKSHEEVQNNDSCSSEEDMWADIPEEKWISKN